jgi:hypothetical protein
MIPPCSHPECVGRRFCCFDSSRIVRREQHLGSHCMNGLQCVADFRSCICICPLCSAEKRAAFNRSLAKIEASII